MVYRMFNFGHLELFSWCQLNKGPHRNHFVIHVVYTCILIYMGTCMFRFFFFFCHLRSIVVHRDQSHCPVSFCPFVYVSGSHFTLVVRHSYVPQATHAFLGMLLLCLYMLYTHLHGYLYVRGFFTATESKAEMQAAVWRIPCDFDGSHPDDGSSHNALGLVCHLDSTDYGDMKW